MTVREEQSLVGGGEGSSKSGIASVKYSSMKGRKGPLSKGGGGGGETDERGRKEGVCIVCSSVEGKVCALALSGMEKGAYCGGGGKESEQRLKKGKGPLLLLPPGEGGGGPPRGVCEKEAGCCLSRKKKSSAARAARENGRPLFREEVCRTFPRLPGKGGLETHS